MKLKTLSWPVLIFAIWNCSMFFSFQFLFSFWTKVPQRLFRGPWGSKLKVGGNSSLIFISISIMIIIMFINTPPWWRSAKGEDWRGHTVREDLGGWKKAFGELFSGYRSKFIDVGGINQVIPGIATNWLLIAIAKRPMHAMSLSLWNKNIRQVLRNLLSTSTEQSFGKIFRQVSVRCQHLR